MFHCTALDSLLLIYRVYAHAQTTSALLTWSDENTLAVLAPDLTVHVSQTSLPHPQAGRVTCPPSPQRQTSTRCCPATRTPWMGPIPSIPSIAPARMTWPTLRREISVQLLFNWPTLRCFFICLIIISARRKPEGDRVFGRVSVSVHL